MFGRKEKAALAALPPQQQALLSEHALAVVQSPAEWQSLLAAIAVPNPTIKHHTLAPRSLDVVAPLLRIICEDTPPTGAIGLRIDLRGPNAPGKTVSEHDIPPVPPATKVTESIAWDPWLVLDAKLNNRFVLDLSVVDVLRTRKVRKHGASGKTKWKTKRKAVQRITAKLTLPPGRAYVVPARSGATSWLQVTAKGKGDRNIVIARGKFALSGAETGAWQLNTLMLVIAELFRWVAPEEVAA